MVDLAKLKVTFLAGCLSQGGAERQLFYILRSLRTLGARPSLLSLTRGEYWETKLHALGVPVTWVGQRGSRLLRLRRIAATLREQKPDVIQSQHFFTNLYAVASARALGIREIGAIRNDLRSEVRANGCLLGRLSALAPRVLAANSRQGIRNALRLGVAASHLTYLPNSIDTDAFVPSARAARLGEQVRILGVGRLVRQKRFDVFLDAVAGLSDESGVPVQATIVGDGPDRDDLKRRAARIGRAAGAIRFMGAMSDMATVYHEADVLLLTSDWEGTPNVVLEAMACGVPVVATRVGGLPEIVQDGKTGYLVEPGDVGALVDRLARLRESAVQRESFGICGREYVLANHGLGQLPRFLQGVYEAALA
ncbi:MAG: glycosyltransferase [Pirellulales bacterium]|nr:glycosyltransferase [Pirellulales bacterium]